VRPETSARQHIKNEAVIAAENNVNVKWKTTYQLVSDKSEDTKLLLVAHK